MFTCADPLPMPHRHALRPMALRPMTLRVQQMAMAQPVTGEQPTLLVLRKGHVVLQPKHGARQRAFGAGWATLDPAFADHDHARWSTQEESIYHAVELPVQACSDLLQQVVPWAESGRRPFRFSDPKVSFWVDELVQHCTAGEPHGALYTDAIGMAMLSYLSSRTVGLDTPEPSPAALPRPAVLRIQAHVDEHLTDDLSLKDLAALCGYSPGHLNRVFKESVGLPLHRFVIERRLVQARRMLCSDHTSLADISLACGFANQAHFSTTFKRYVGCTPKAFRQAGQA